MTTDQNTPDGVSALAELWSGEQDAGGYAQVDPGVRRRRRRIGLIVVAVVLVVVLGAPTAYVAWALAAPVSAPVATLQQPPVPAPAAPAALALPADGAAAVSISGADAYFAAAPTALATTSGTNDPRPLASITKVITALVVLDAKPLANADDPGPTLTFDGWDNDLYDKYFVLGATVDTMPTNSQMSQRDALAMMLVPSASNYADAVSTWAFGSPGAFLGATRRWLAANGLTGTTIVEPTGISAGNTSTPSDLVTIGKIAAAHPVVAKLAATPSLSTGAPGIVETTNDLLGTSGITGLKTGNLGPGNYNLLYTASLDVGVGEPVAVTGVALAGESRQSVNAGVLALIDSIHAGFHTVPLATAGDVLGAYETPWGSTAKLILSDDASIFTWSDTPITVTMDARTPASYQDGEVVGSITWTAGPKTTTVDLEVEGTIEPPDESWRLTHPGELG